MKLLFIVLGLFSLNVNARGIEKSQIKRSLVIESSKLDAKQQNGFFKLVKQNPSSSVILTGDLDGDGLEDVVKISKNNPDQDCDAAQVSLCNSLIVTNEENSGIKTRAVHLVSDSYAGGQAQKGRQTVSFTSRSSSIYGSNSEITINSVEEVSLKKHIGMVKYDVMSVVFLEPSKEQVYQYRKGWDGTVKGGNKSITMELISDDGKRIGSYTIPIVDDQGEYSETKSSILGDHQKLDSILNLIR